jgi:transcriptional regulator with XRE-family HTH domain
MSGTTTLVRRQLGIRLKRLREKAGKTLADVEAASGVGSPSKLWRIESGRSSVRTGDVRELCALYEASNSVLEPLLALARATKSDGWSEDYDSAVRAGLGLYPSLETDASVIRAYNAELIHDLIQTPDYHRAVTAIEPAPSEFAQTRAERLTACFERASPCRFTAILGEAALVRQIEAPARIGGPGRDRRPGADLRRRSSSRAARGRLHPPRLRRPGGSGRGLPGIADDGEIPGAGVPTPRLSRTLVGADDPLPPPSPIPALAAPDPHRLAHVRTVKSVRMRTNHGPNVG